MLINKSIKKAYIVGAQSRAKTLTGYLHVVCPDIQILAYLVDDLKENDEKIYEVPVCALDADSSFDLTAAVFIATKGVFHEKITNELTELGFLQIIPVTVEVDNFFRNEYVKCIYAGKNRAFEKLADLSADHSDVTDAAKSHCIYVAQSIYDNKLESTYVYETYEKPIQVGAVLTDRRLTDLDGKLMLTDNNGENISNKNKQYCELTALYWMWKHATEDVVGLAHYRRHFILPDDWTQRMHAHSVDVILPVPTCILPSISDNYKERHDASDWEYLMQYLEFGDKRHYEEAKQLFAETLYSPCNMFIAKKEVVSDLCEWMFPILDAVVMHGGEKEDSYQNRYAGFISERLITLFFHLHQNDYKIVYADRMFLR